MPAKRHTVDSIALELRTLLPTLTEQASIQTVRTLLRAVCQYTDDETRDPTTPVPSAHRTILMRHARRRYL